MLNVVLYTFSTIAQSLAGAIGLLGAVALFRVQWLRSERDERANRIGRQLESRGVTRKTIDVLFYDDNFVGLLELADVNLGQDDLLDVRRDLGKLLDAQARILKRLWGSFIITIALIVASVLALMAAAQVSESTAVMPVFVVTFVALLVCIGSYVLLMMEALR